MSIIVNPFIFNVSVGLQTEKLLGYDSIGSSTLADTYIWACPVTPSNTGTLYDIYVYHNGGSGNLIAGVYDDGVNYPDVLLEKKSVAASGTAGWQKVTLDTGVSITASTQYWLAWVFTAGLTYRYQSSINIGMKRTTSTGYSDLPASYPATFTTSSNAYSIYGESQY